MSTSQTARGGEGAFQHSELKRINILKVQLQFIYTHRAHYGGPIQWGKKTRNVCVLKAYALSNAKVDQ